MTADNSGSIGVKIQVAGVRGLCAHKGAQVTFTRDAGKIGKKATEAVL